jgi:hypothetical protein
MRPTNLTGARDGNRADGVDGSAGCVAARHDRTNLEQEKGLRCALSAIGYVRYRDAVGLARTSERETWTAPPRVHASMGTMLNGRHGRHRRA